MKKITAKWLTEMNACCSEEEKEEAEKIGDIFQIINILKEKNRLRDVHWLLTNYFNKRQRIKYAIFASEQFIDNFENRYPEDKRPRSAIEAAKAYLKNPCKETENAAASAASLAFITANMVYINANANSVANSAASAAYSVVNTASAASVIVYATISVAAGTDNSFKKTMKKIINYGIGLLNKQFEKENEKLQK